METTPQSYFALHGFLCTNSRPDDHPRSSCVARGSKQLMEYLKERTKALGLGPAKGIRLQQSGCLDRCELGPVMVIYPEGTWYAVRTKDDIDEILTVHVQGGGRVTRLELGPKDRRREQLAGRVAD